MPQQNRASTDTAADATKTPTNHQAGETATAGPALPLSLPIPGLPGGVTPKRMLWWGSLAAVAAAGLVEWPVVAVVGAGSWVAERLAREDIQHDAGQRR